MSICAMHTSSKVVFITGPLKIVRSVRYGSRENPRWDKMLRTCGGLGTMLGCRAQRKSDYYFPAFASRRWFHFTIAKPTREFKIINELVMIKIWLPTIQL